MSRNYTRDHLKIAVSKILQTLGWNSINSTPLEILTDILGSYIGQITKTTNNYANEFGCTQPNLDHLGLAFRDLNVSVGELEEYVKYVNFGPPPSQVPKFPITKEDHLNFLKPGSKEVVTRPVHIHEHLPPMHPFLEGSENGENSIKSEETDDANGENSALFKKPADISPSDFKRSFRKEEEGSRPTREIQSVMMTRTGFLSPAREGKLPEAKTPISSMDPILPINPPAEPLDPNKKPNKIIKKVEKKRVRPGALEITPNDEKRRRLNPMKNLLKAKQPKPPGKVPHLTPTNEITTSPVSSKPNQTNKVNKALAAARLKTEKLNTTITPITINTPTPPPPLDNIDKLFSEPDKKKVNIFKKISNVKNDVNGTKIKKEDIKQESRESSPDLIIDEPDDVIHKLNHLPSDVTIEPINSAAKKSPEKMDPYFDDDSQPGTPSTPKTPEMISHSPPIFKERRKRKDGKKVKKIPKPQTPQRIDNDIIDLDMERPKTPEALVPKIDLGLPLMPPMGSMGFPFHFGGPGLIPNPFSNPLMSFGPKNLPLGLGPFEDLHRPPPIEPSTSDFDPSASPSSKSEKKNKEHKKEKKDKIKKRNKKDKVKNKAEKKKLKEEKKEKIKKEKKEKRKDKELKENDPQGVKITFKIKSPSPRPETPETRKLNIKPIVKKEEEEEEPPVSEEKVKRETSPGLAKISALVFGPPKPKPVIPPAPTPPALNDSFPSSSSDSFVNQMKKPMPKPIPKIRTKEIRREPIVEVPILPPAPPSKYVDADGNLVWICPGCGRQDDGSPMIGCDGCDAWYHWVCVGIQVPPDSNEDWYCRHCLSKKNEDLQTDKQKKKRKKKDKKDH